MGFLIRYIRAGSITAQVLSLLLSATVSLCAVAAPSVTEKQVWAISIDNDLFSPVGSSDRDFTGGMALSYSGQRGVRYWRPLDEALARLDSLSSIHSRVRPASIVPSIEVGLYGFTPNDLTATDADRNDRPYASLSYLSVSRLYQLSGSGNVVSSSLTVGLLGTSLFRDVQRRVHAMVGTDEPQGWHNQISNSGELTARYHLAYHDYWKTSSASSRLKTTYYSSIGYLTEMGVALSTRLGQITSPDHRFNPELISYGERVNETATTPSHGEENYFWGGITLKARFYNVFLQGQFRNSVHTYEYRDLHPLIIEAWLGYTISFAQSYKVSYVVRAQSSEIRTGDGDRGHIWGGLIVSYSR